MCSFFDAFLVRTCDIAFAACLQACKYLRVLGVVAGGALVAGRNRARRCAGAVAAGRDIALWGSS